MSNIEDILKNSYSKPIDLSKMSESISDNENVNEMPVSKRSRQTAGDLQLEKDRVLYDLLNITHPIFNLRDEFNTISIFWYNNNEKYPEFNELLNQYVRNTNEDKIFEKALQLKASIMTFIAEKMNNGK